MTEQPITFKAQMAHCQSGFMAGPDSVLIKLILLGLDKELAGSLYELQETAFVLTAFDVMGDITVNASIPDTQSGFKPNKKSPQLQILIPKSDALTSFRFYALYGRVFDVQIERDSLPKEKPAKKKSEPKLSGPYGRLWNFLVAKGFFTYPCVIAALEAEAIEDERAEDTIRRIFEVPTRADISPERLIAWLKDIGQADALPTDNAILMIERGVVKTTEQKQ